MLSAAKHLATKHLGVKHLAVKHPANRYETLPLHFVQGQSDNQRWTYAGMY